MTDSKQYTLHLVDGTLVGPVDIRTVKRLLLDGIVSEEDRSRLLSEIFASISEAPQLLEDLARQDTSELLHAAEPSSSAFNSLDILQGIPPAAVYVSEEASAAYRGQLEDVFFPRLLYFFHTRQMTGKLQLIGPGDYKVNIFFSKGAITQIESPLAQDDLYARLLSSELCSHRQLQEAAARADKKGGELCDHLVALGYIDPHGLLNLLHQQFTEQLQACFRMWEGPYFFFSDERPENNSIPHSVETYSVIQSGINEAYDFSRLQWILEPFYKSSVKKTENSHIQIEELRLSPRQTRLLHMIESSRSLWELFELAIQRSVMDELSAHRFIFFLAQLEVVLFDNHTLGPRMQDKMNLLGG